MKHEMDDFLDMTPEEAKQRQEQKRAKKLACKKLGLKQKPKEKTCLNSTARAVGGL